MIADRHKESEIWFRVMMRDDLSEVLTIEAEAFVQPWSETDFLDILEDPDTVALIAKCDGDVVGYIFVAWNRGWTSILSCAVKSRYRGRGLGTKMMTSLIHAQVAGRCKGVLVKVPERNLEAQLFFRSCGFKFVRTLRSYLLDSQDVYVMQYLTPGSTADFSDDTWPEDELMPLWEVKHA